MPVKISPSRPIRIGSLSMALALAVLIGALQGCASVQAPTTQTIQIQTPGCATASCELTNDRGIWHMSQAPGSVSVSVSQEDLRITCRAGDAASGRVTASSSRPAKLGAGAVTGAVAGGAVTGVALGASALAFIPPLGVIAVLTGASLGALAGDAADSRERLLRYPESVSIPMNCSAASGSAEIGFQGAGLGLGIRGMTNAEASTLGLGERTAVMVISVVTDGRAAASGVREGDVILSLNGQDLADAADLEERVWAVPKEMPLKLRVWRDRRAVELLLVRSTNETP